MSSNSSNKRLKKPLDTTYTFCLDICHDSEAIRQLLLSRGHKIEQVRKHQLICGSEDFKWIPYVSERKWVILTRDNNIRKNLIELSSVYHFNARMFCFRSKNLTGQMYVEIMEKCLPRVLRILEDNPPPFIANVVKSGEVKLIDLGDKRIKNIIRKGSS